MSSRSIEPPRHRARHGGRRSPVAYDGIVNRVATGDPGPGQRAPTATPAPVAPAAGCRLRGSSSTIGRMPATNPSRQVGAWPELPAEAWFDTLETVHLFTQVIGKTRMVNSPWLNHSWSVTLYPTASGLTTSLVPYGTEGFEWAFDFIDHALTLTTTTGQRRRLDLEPMTVADFYSAVMRTMNEVDMPTEISVVPNEIADAIPFPDDRDHAAYEVTHVHSWWRAVLQANRVFSRFRAGYLGKASPVQFFWGSFDLAVTRFSGRTAPPHGGGLPNFPDDVAREAYSHEVTSVGFWPGNRAAPTPIFYAYAYPTPEGFSSAPIAPSDAFWLDELGEFALPYAAVARADNPDESLTAFLKSTHAAAADLAGWARTELECDDPHGPDWWAGRPHD